MEMSPFQISAESSDISLFFRAIFGVKSDLLGPLISCDESITMFPMSLTQKTHPYAKRDLPDAPKFSRSSASPFKKNLSSIYRFTGFLEAEAFQPPLNFPTHPRGRISSSPRGLVLDKDRYPLRSVGKPPSSCSHSGHFRLPEPRQLFSTKIPSYMKGRVEETNLLIH